MPIHEIEREEPVLIRNYICINCGKRLILKATQKHRDPTPGNRPCPKCGGQRWRRV